FEEQSGWLVAGISEPGWIADLGPREASLFAAALAGLYKRAGVDLVREEIAARLPARAPYDIAPEGLVVWDPSWKTETVHRLDPERDPSWFFSHRPLPWDAWVAFWSSKGLDARLTPGGEPFTLLTR